MYNDGLIIGRFQPITKGHEELIKAAILVCKRVNILVGSAQESGTDRNPFGFELRRCMILDVIESLGLDRRKFKITPLNDMTNEGDNSEEWGEYLLSRAYIRPNVMIYGNDDCRSTWFNKESIKDISEFIISRYNENGICASDVRNTLKNDDFESFCAMTNDVIHKDYRLLRRQMGLEVGLTNLEFND